MRIKYTLREAVPTDARAIAETHVASWRAAYRGIIDDAWLDGRTFEEREESWSKSLQDWNDSKAMYLAFDGVRLAGFAVVGAPRTDGYAGYAELHAIYNHPDYYGRGAGRILFDTAKDWARARGCTKMFVSLLRDNTLGREFYERTGAVMIPGSEGMVDFGENDYPCFKYEWKNIR